MKNSISREILGVAASLLLLPACAGSGSGVPSAASAPQTLSSQARDGATVMNLSGQYKGTLSVGQIQNTKARFDLTQYQNAVGGRLTISFGSPPVTDDAVLTVNGSTLTGTFVSPAGPCVFTTTATYDAKTRKLSGIFNPVHGCSASTNGSYSLKHQCNYKSGSKDDIRPNAGGVRSC